MAQADVLKDLALKDLAPTGKLRAAINLGNGVLAQKDADGNPKGITPDLARELGKRLSVPVDTYAVGSALFDNHAQTVTDYTADVVRVKVHGEWVDMAKIGRSPRDNADLERVW